MESSGGELAWFRGEVARSILRPREFARALAREHFGLAGVLVAVLAGLALALAIDSLILVAKGLGPLDFLAQVLIDAFFLAIRLAVTVAVVAAAAHYAMRLLRHREVTMDQAFTAFSFALSPLLLAPISAVLVTVAPELVGVGAAIALLAIARAAVGLAINLWALAPPPLAAVMFAVMLATSALTSQDQISRVRFAGYAIAPELVPDLRATPASGTTFEMIDFTITLPSGWRNASTGQRGEAARFESEIVDLKVARAGGLPLATADAYADSVSIAERQGLRDAWRERSVVRINGLVAVDDRYGGVYEGRRVLYRQFTVVPATHGLALVFHYVEPPDEAAALAQAASIAATWRPSVSAR